MSSSPSSSASSDYSDDEFLSEITSNFDIQGYMFEPKLKSNDGDSSDLSSSDSSEAISDGVNNRLTNGEWCKCGHCQIMDRAVECVCCQEIKEILAANQKVSSVENLPLMGCITDNPGFKANCLNRWVLEASFFHFKHKYGTRSNIPEHKINRHIAYRRLVRWCWGILGRQIRVVFPSCAVMCIRAHFPPPGIEDEFEFVGFLYADE